MANYRRRRSWYNIVSFKQVQLLLNENGSKGLFVLIALNETRKQVQIFPFCDPHIPGEWMTMCLTIKTSGHSQNFTIFKDGKVCNQKEFNIEAFEGFFLPSRLTVRDM